MGPARQVLVKVADQELVIADDLKNVFQQEQIHLTPTLKRCLKNFEWVKITKFFWENNIFREVWEKLILNKKVPVDLSLYCIINNCVHRMGKDRHNPRDLEPGPSRTSC